ncbi:hypothetical protein GCM10011385_28650 [Nitratireductor aestuarii]|uniref:DUF2322 domain-containing protein n=1 Tax=Nitratireductor aestuarii TaxID=1735103 RepID=A0A916W7N4_9HYPH|nr:DUF2322 family protein [Nitratireductor aestuarii]GGA73044.1 hypothetical protein GCM10011385_28650 [Nitratireductor aestuarii]
MLLEAREQHLEKGPQMIIQPTASFKENLSRLPSIEDVARIELIDADGTVVGSIENQPGKQGSLAIYQYLHQVFGTLDAEAAEHGLAVFAELTEEARNHSGSHPNIDRLLEIAGGAAPLSIQVIAV